MPEHLAGCVTRQTAIENANRGKGAQETLYHLRARDAGHGYYWLDLEMAESKTLKHLDSYLRAIWLECCGHLSQFSIGGWGSKEIAKSRQIGQVFRPGVELTHIYDFGTSSETLIKAVRTRQGRPTTPHPIALMARNLKPEYPCIACGSPSTWLCTDCLIEKDEWAALCSEHITDHTHDEYGGPLELVNSPRIGLCGYTGPADPPY